MNKTSKTYCQKKRYGKLIIPLLIGIPVILIFSVIICRTETEALSPDEIMAKTQWDETELKNALANSMLPAMAGQRKQEIIKHLDDQLKKFPPSDRDRIRRDAVVAAVNISLDRIRKMPEGERSKMVQTIQKKAEAGYASLRNDRRTEEIIASHIKTKEVEAFTNEVNRVIFAELTPEEKIQFAPITKLWIKTMKTMGR